MGVQDSILSRGMSQRIQAALPTIQTNFFKQAALLALLKSKNQIKWGGSHTGFDWYIRNVPTNQDPEWGGGELAVRTFEEQKPANKLELDYCWLERTYGVSDRSIEANRHAAGRDKIYDVLKENLELATIFIYNTFGPSIYTGDGLGQHPSGLVTAMGTPYESSSTIAVAAGSTYAGKTLNTGAVSAYDHDVTTMGFDDEQFAPRCVSVHEVPNASSSPKWSTDAIIDLAFMASWMTRTADVSGTGKMISPNAAFMASDPYGALVALLAGNQATYNVPVGNEALLLAGWRNIQVDTILATKDDQVPDDSGSKERVIVADTTQIKIMTTHTKAEGLIRTEFDASSPIISGAVGVLKMNMNFMVSSPSVLGCIVGADD